MIMVEVQLHCALVPGEKRGKLSAPVELPAGADGAWVAMGGWGTMTAATWKLMGIAVVVVSSDWRRIVPKLAFSLPPPQAVCRLIWHVARLRELQLILVIKFAGGSASFCFGITVQSNCAALSSSFETFSPRHVKEIFRSASLPCWETLLELKIMLPLTQNQHFDYTFQTHKSSYKYAFCMRTRKLWCPWRF